MIAVCPCCGQPARSGLIPVGSLLESGISGQKRRILTELVERYPGSVATDRLVDALYFDDPNGGADNALNIVYIQIGRLRNAIKQYGWTIPPNLGGNGSHGRYRLEPIEVQA